MKLTKTNSGALLWKKAKKIIPGGNQLLSKRAEQFLPEYWPSYYERAKGVTIWDLDKNKYTDMGIMGIGTCVLGYANNDVDKAVKQVISKGSMSTLNCYEEVELAEKLVKLHPWSDMVRFSKTGGEACTIAIRIARAFSKKDKVAFCGYHGWHDWYLAANIANSSNLDGQLLPGLDPAGVPRVLRNTSIPFNYGKIEELEKIVKDNPGEVGVIMMEVSRHKEVDLEFLNQVKKIAGKIGAVLIFDEVSSGFRVSLGGMHLLYNLEPDIVVLGKALGNGYPISAVIGNKKVMDCAQDSFISSSLWTERIGFAAALATIEVFEKKHVIDHIVNVGNYLKKGLTNIFRELSLRIDTVGLPSAPIMHIHDNPLLVKTIFNQEMLKRGYLTSSVVYISFAHNKKIIDKYLKEAGEVFSKIARYKKNNKLKKLLMGSIAHSGFRRLA